MNENKAPFWRRKTLSELSRDEWEALCDGCARCCLEKLEDVDTGRVIYTHVACRFLDIEACRCRVYAERHQRTDGGCLEMKPVEVKDLNWLPKTCAYRKIAAGEDLEWWHPLVSGRPDTVHEAGISVQGQVVPGRYVHPDDLEAYAVSDDAALDEFGK